MRYNFPEDQHSHQGKFVKQTIFHLHIRSSVGGLRTSPRWYLIGKIPLFLTWLVFIRGGNFSARLPVIHKTDEGHISGNKKDNLSTIEAFWNIIFQNSELLVWQKEEKAKLEIIFQVTGTGIPHNVILLCSTQIFSVFDEIQPNKLQYVNLNHHSEKFDVMIEQIFINIVWNMFELGHSWINEQRNWIFHITTLFTSTFLSYTLKPETLIKHVDFSIIITWPSWRRKNIEQIRSFDSRLKVIYGQCACIYAYYAVHDMQFWLLFVRKDIKRKFAHICFHFWWDACNCNIWSKEGKTFISSEILNTLQTRPAA